MTVPSQPIANNGSASLFKVHVNWDISGACVRMLESVVSLPLTKFFKYTFTIMTWIRLNKSKLFKNRIISTGIIYCAVQM